MNMSLDEISRRLGGEVYGTYVRAPGPGDSAGNRSMKVEPKTGAPDGFLVHSFAGDDPLKCKYVRERLGTGAFKPNGNGSARPNGNGSAQTQSKPKSKVKAIYDYTSEEGELLSQVVRFEPKDFRQRRPDVKGGWIWSLGDTRRVLYRLSEVLEAVANKQ